MSAKLTEERYGQLVDYLSKGIYPEGFAKNQRRGLRQQAEIFKVKNGVLFHCSASEPKLRRVVVSQAEKERLIKACHDGIDGGHFGRDKTTSKVLA